MDKGRGRKEDSIRLGRQGAMVRPVKLCGFPASLRVTIGKYQDYAKFLQALGRIPAMPERTLKR